jgi:hypothetical protein
MGFCFAAGNGALPFTPSDDSFIPENEKFTADYATKTFHG